MRPADVARFAWRSLSAHPARTLLMVLATSIGVAAVVVLTSLGEGARSYVRNQFVALGTNLIIIFPGHSATAGGFGGVISGRTPRDLTIDDALALRRIPGVIRTTPINVVSGEIAWGGRRRDVPMVGSTAELHDVWHLTIGQGDFLPPQNPRDARFVCVIGSTVRREIFGAVPPVGQWVRVGDYRYRVVGVIAPTGTLLGLDVDEVVIVPVAAAQVQFNLPSLLRIAVETRAREDVRRVRREVLDMLRERHNGEEDVTVITEDAVSTAFDAILLALTLAVGGIASISLGVAGILIMNVMLVAVSQRTSEIGLLKALGATPAQIRHLFFAEAAILSAFGGVVGSILGQLGSLVIRRLYPRLPAFAPSWAALAAFAIAIVTGIVFSLLPARRAARLDPALALARR